MVNALVATDLRDKLRSEVHATGASELLPHHRREALFLVAEHVDFLEVAEAIANDAADLVAERIAAGHIYRPSLAQLADWCVDPAVRFQIVILQPYVLAQRLSASAGALN